MVADFENTYWYVEEPYLTALQAGVAPQPHCKTVTDQTVWRFQGCPHGYLTGISATNIGGGWQYMMMIGSILRNGTVKISFSPLAASDPASEPVTIGDGTYDGRGFLMQMTSGTAGLSTTHWAWMMPVTPSMPQWHALPGYPDTSVPSLTGLNTPLPIRA